MGWNFQNSTNNPTCNSSNNHNYYLQQEPVDMQRILQRPQNIGSKHNYNQHEWTPLYDWIGLKKQTPDTLMTGQLDPL